MDDSDEQAALLAEALRVLDIRLGEAASLLASAKSPSRERLAAVCALDGFIRFISACQNWQGRQFPLQKLALGLLDLDNGRTAPMLRANARDAAGGPAISEAEVGQRIHGAFIMQSLMKYAGMSKTDAAKWVSTRLAAAGYDVSFHTVIDWRKDANNPRNGALNKRYRDLQEASVPHWRDPIPYAQTVIARLIAFMPKKGE